MEFRNPYEEKYRNPEMCLTPEQLGLMPLNYLDSLPSDQIAATCKAAMIIFKYYKDNSRLGDISCAAMKGTEIYIAYCIHLLRTQQARKELRQCLNDLSRCFNDGVAMLSLIYSVTGKSVDDLLEEANDNGELRKSDEEFFIYTRKILHDALEDTID